MPRLNEKLILRTEANEIFTPKIYKLYPNNVNNSLWGSLLPAQKINVNKVAAIHYLDGEGFIQKNITEINNSAILTNINYLRNGIVGFVNIQPTPDMTLEFIPSSYHISETIENLERLSNEYTRKNSMLSYISQNIFDSTYATKLWMVGKDQEIEVVDGKLDQDVRISGYISVEDAPQDIQINLVFRGIPIPMRKTLTSQLGGLYSFIFTYPQYLFEGNIDAIQAINHLEVINYTGARFYYGTTHYFDIDNFAGYANKLSNIHIVNKNTRNLFNQTELITNP